MNTDRYNEMIDATWIDNGDAITTAAEVRRYCTVSNMQSMFGGGAVGTVEVEQSALDEFAAEYILRNGLR